MPVLIWEAPTVAPAAASMTLELTTGGGPAPEATISVSSGRPVPVENGAAAAPALRATAWEEGGQVWVGYADSANLARNGSALRGRLDRALLDAVTPY